MLDERALAHHRADVGGGVHLHYVELGSGPLVETESRGRFVPTGSARSSWTWPGWYACGAERAHVVGHDWGAGPGTRVPMTRIDRDVLVIWGEDDPLLGHLRG